MNPFDMAIVVLLGYCIIVGIFKGFIKEVASIVGVVGGFYAAFYGYGLLTPAIGVWIKTPAYQNILAFILIFLIVCLAVNLIGALLRLLIKLVLLGAVDRFFGAMVGALKGVLLAYLLYILLIAFLLLYILLIAFLPIGGKQLVAESRIAPYVNSVSKTLVYVIPKEKRRAFMYKMESLKKKWSTGEEMGDS